MLDESYSRRQAGKLLINFLMPNVFFFLFVFSVSYIHTLFSNLYASKDFFFLFHQCKLILFSDDLFVYILPLLGFVLHLLFLVFALREIFVCLVIYMYDSSNRENE